ncbi:MAG: hypothetical protein LUO79_09000 [Methanomassiliicoccales archaeon]|nr:hypothetical protein [Methanomassiliicoccales archaeon]
MKVIGVLTEDFHFFYELVRSLKERGLEFVSLERGRNVPANVGVVITTPGEADAIDFEPLVATEDAETAINVARCVLAGGTRVRTVVLGLDPGSTTGIAIYGEGRLLATDEVDSPEKAAESVGKLLSCLRYAHSLARVGHGDATKRDRVIRSIWGLVDEVEVVDETGTTGRKRDDVEAAKRIAMTKGERLESLPDLNPTPGEIRDIQRLSRIESKGRVTISAELATAVARGEITMGQALQSKRKVRRAGP